MVRYFLVLLSLVLALYSVTACDDDESDGDGDADGDGDLDAFVVNDGANTIWLNGGPACAALIGACCQPIGICDELTESDCIGIGGAYGGGGTGCDSHECPPGA